MRAVLIIVTSLAVIGIVVFTVIYTPTTGKTNVSVTRIDMAVQPQPVLQTDPAADRILEFFPKVEEWPLVQPTIASDTMKENEETPAPESTAPKPKKSDIVSDKSHLLALIEDWAYVDFSEIVSKKLTQKKGVIHQTRSHSYLTVSEGQTLDNGIKIKQLTDSAAMLNLGEAVFHLRMAKIPPFFDEVQKTYRPLTPDEQAQAYDYYMARFGEKFKEQSKNYKPPYGTQMPRKVTPAERQKGLEDYMKAYGNQFQQNPNNPGMSGQNSFPYSNQQREAYQKYWESHHAGQPMPDFDKIFGVGSQVGPGNRIQSTPESN